ncbi:hypothetical protein SEUCBS140593_001089 [Sporothrix eucalyptigena]|uniref:Uncharacterized protein n=1 Tax=Sporothrix eucalyptigena TaxID=1812306 RepID=A0ABP0AVE6_9PEZI
MSTGKVMKLGVLALMATGQVMADNGVLTVSSSSDFITRTMGHITYTLLRPTTTYDPYPDYIEATGPTLTVTATAIETVVSTSVEMLTVTATVTSDVDSTVYPLTSPIPNIPMDVEKRDVTTVTFDGGYGTPLLSTGDTETVMGGGPSTKTVSATTTTTITGSYFVTYPTGALSVTTTTTASSSGVASDTTAISTPSTGSGSTSVSVTSTNGTLTTSVISSSVLTINSDLTVPAESETNPAPSKPTATQTAGSDRAVPQAMTWMAAMSAVVAFVFAI